MSMSPGYAFFLYMARRRTNLADVDIEKGDLSEITGLDLVGQTMSEATMRYWQLSEANLRMARTLKRFAKKEEDATKLLNDAKLLERDAVTIIEAYVDTFLRKPQTKEILEQRANHANAVKEQDETQKSKHLQKLKDIQEKAEEEKKRNVLIASAAEINVEVVQ